MALTILVLILAFVWIYSRIGPLLSDFIPTSANSSTAAPASQDAESSSESDQAAQPAAQESAAPSASASEAPQGQPTHRIKDGPSINFRAEPTTESDTLIVLSPGTTLKFLDEQEQVGGSTWMHFQTQDGTEGWIRSIDVDET